MVEHRMIGRKVELADDVHRLGLGLDAVELDAVIEDELLAAREPPEEIEVPPRAAVLAVGRERRPISSCLRMIFSISRSSTARSASAVIAP